MVGGSETTAVAGGKKYPRPMWGVWTLVQVQRDILQLKIKITLGG